MSRVLVLAALALSSAACWTSYEPKPSVNPVAASKPDWGGLGCATVRVVGDHVDGQTANAVIELTNVSGKDGCVVYVGVSEVIITAPGKWFQVNARPRVTVDAGKVESVVVPLALPQAVSCETPRSIMATLNEGDANIPRIAFRDREGKDHGSSPLPVYHCLPSAPVATPEP